MELGWSNSGFFRDRQHEADAATIEEREFAGGEK
jgi:hypothetical protein